MTGSRAQLYNGFMLLFTFFSCRLVYGTYQSVMVFKDIWAAIDRNPSPDLYKSSVMGLASESSTVPFWLGGVYLASNLTLNSLNFYWFVMMIKAVRKRFEPTKQPQTEAEVDISSITSALSNDAILQRRRV